MKGDNIDFFATVASWTRKIPAGCVATYGQIAGLISTPRAARMVGYALRQMTDRVPWQRVINASGMISIENIDYPKDLQAKLLINEGVKVTKRNGNYWVNLKAYLWKPK